MGAVSDVPLNVAVVSLAAGAVVAASVPVPAVSVFSTRSRLQAAARITQRKTRISLRMEQLSFGDRVRQKMRPAETWLAAHADLVSLLLIAVAVLRIVSTLTIFSATSDEGMHVTAGLQLVTEGRYAWQLENPPLPRVIFGWLAAKSGATFRTDIEPMEMVRSLFYSSGHYQTLLFYGRVGNVLFFILAAVAAWRLARRELGREGGAMSTLLFTTQPVILGYSGIANFDLACVAGFALVLLAFSRWLEKPTAARALIAGAAYGLSIGLKFSNVLFGAAGCVAIYTVHFIAEENVRRSWRRVLVALPLAVIATLIALWGTYGFTFGSLQSYGMTKPAPETSAARLLDSIDVTTPIPAPHFAVGVANLTNLEARGHLSYAFGRRTEHGWWWYFPAATLFKTTLATLILVLAGFMVSRGKVFASAVAAILAIFITTAPAAFDLGVRYVLPLYVPLSIAAAGAAMSMLRRGNAPRIAAIALLLWHCVASAVAHPDYFPYFNELAGRQPGRLFVDSNLDWGQDLLRLRRVLREEKVEKIGMHVAGLHDFDKLGIRSWYQLDPWVPARGWIAVSEHVYRITAPDGGFSWLRGRSYRRVGTSIRLYYVP